MNKKIIKNFFVFEGIDGSGTTTQIELLKNYLIKNDKKVFNTAEPTNLETGKFLRRCLSGEISLHAETMLMLFAADRNEHIFSEFGIIKALESNDYVISDRYIFSSLAYQGAAGFFNQAEKLNENFPLPEILFFLDADFEKTFERIEKRNNGKEIYENKLFQKKVQEFYYKTLEKYKNTNMKIYRIDGNAPVKNVHTKIIKNLKEIIL